MKARESILPIFVPHLGCPMNCVFCNQNHISGALTPATAETVESAVRTAAALPQSGAKRQLAFYGGSFTAIPAEQQIALLEAAQKEIRQGNIDSIRLSTRPDAVYDEVICRLKNYSVETIELGAQSMDDTVLKLSARGHTAQQVRDASRMVKDAGFRLILQMMTGLPGDSGEQSIQTAREIIALHPDGVRIYPTVIVRDTMLEQLWKEGRYHEHSVEDAVEICARILPVFEAAGIPVIRLGLNPTEDLSGGDALGGAYHPALGELVKSRILRNQAEKLLEQHKILSGSTLKLNVDAGKLSQMIGQHRCNVNYLREKFQLKELRVGEHSEKNGKISIFLLK